MLPLDWRSASRFLALVLLIPVGACSERGLQAPDTPDSPDDPDSPAQPQPPGLVVTGTWEGVADPIGVSITIFEELNVNGVPTGNLLGSGVLGSTHATFPVGVTGDFDDPAVTLSFQIDGEADVTFTGALTFDLRMVGVLDGGGFDNFGIALLPVGEGESVELPFDPSDPAAEVGGDFAGTYSGTWTIFIQAGSAARDIEETVEGSCSGTVSLDGQSLMDRLFGKAFGGSYLMLDDGDCTVDGSTVSGGVKDGQLRSDGGVNFGLEIPGSDGNFFEDVLAGSGVKPPTLVLLGCEILNKDLDNQMDGSILAGRLAAVASASLSCPDEAFNAEGDDVVEDAITVKMRVSVDATK